MSDWRVGTQLVQHPFLVGTELPMGRVTVFTMISLPEPKLVLPDLPHGWIRDFTQYHIIYHIISYHVKCLWYIYIHIVLFLRYRYAYIRSYVIWYTSIFFLLYDADLYYTCLRAASTTNRPHDSSKAIIVTKHVHSFYDLISSFKRYIPGIRVTHRSASIKVIPGTMVHTM